MGAILALVMNLLAALPTVLKIVKVAQGDGNGSRPPSIRKAKGWAKDLVKVSAHRAETLATGERAELRKEIIEHLLGKGVPDIVARSLVEEIAAEEWAKARKKRGKEKG